MSEEGKIISFATQKGGSGKSTLLMLLTAATYNRTKKKILVIDSDPQQTVKTIADQEEPLPFPVESFDWTHSKADEYFPEMIQKAKLQYDVIFMDLPGQLGEASIYFPILASDVVIVPLYPSVLDIASTLKFLEYMPEVAKKRKKKRLPFQVFGVVNRRPRTIEHRGIKAIDGKYGLQLFNASLSDRKRYRTDISLLYQITSSTDEEDELNQLYSEFSTKCF
jgi:chromosome partitioning protein